MKQGLIDELVYYKPRFDFSVSEKRQIVSPYADGIHT